LAERSAKEYAMSHDDVLVALTMVDPVADHEISPSEREATRRRVLAAVGAPLAQESRLVPVRQRRLRRRRLPRLIAAAAAIVAADHKQVAAPAARSRRRASRAGRTGSARWTLRLAAAVVTVVAVVATVQVVDVGPPAVRYRAGGGAPASAAELGALAAKAVRDVPAPNPKPGQWMYIKTLVAHDAGFRVESEDESHRLVPFPAVAPRAVEWWSKAGSKPGAQVQAVTNRKGNALVGPPLIQGVHDPGLPSLPTDPDRLLKVLHDYHSRTYGMGGAEAWHQTFTTIAGMLTNLLVPPELQAALFQAMAKIPGVIVVQDTVDAAGRRGMALALVKDQVRFEVILEKGTYRYLGLANIVTSDHDDDICCFTGKHRVIKLPMRKGQVLYRTARLTLALVDGPNQRPSDAASEPGTESGTGP
jgi:hypothetical protein